MRRIHLWVLASAGIASVALFGWFTPQAESMCGYFRPIIVDLKQPSEMLQPSQIAFVTWDPENKIETVTVQPRFEGNAADFGMVIPTPSQPKLHEMPRDFFKALEVFTTPKRRVFPESKLVPRMFDQMVPMAARAGGAEGLGGGPRGAVEEKKTTVAVLEIGQVGNLDYKIIAAGRADDLFQWLKDNKYSFDGDEATLNYYVQKKYFFTVMKIDTLQMKKNKDGSFVGDVTPTRFTFTSDKLVYPTRITQVSVKDVTDAVFYVQAPFKVDLPGDMTYQYQWVSSLQHIVQSMGPQELTTANNKWLQKIQPGTQELLDRGQKLGFNFQGPDGGLVRPIRVRPEGKPAAADDRKPSTLEWAKRITNDDVQILAGTRPYTETAPDPDDGFTIADMRNPQRSVAITKIIQHRLAKFQKEQPRGYLVREAKKEDLKLLPILKGHVQPDQYITKIRHTFTRAEMGEDLVLVPATVGGVADTSEHEEVLRAMVFGGRGGRFGGFGGPVEIDQLQPRLVPPGQPK